MVILITAVTEPLRGSVVTGEPPNSHTRSTGCANGIEFLMLPLASKVHEMKWHSVLPLGSTEVLQNFIPRSGVRNGKVC
jgi:hypothetical protein